MNNNQSARSKFVEYFNKANGLRMNLCDFIFFAIELANRDEAYKVSLLSIYTRGVFEDIFDAGTIVKFGDDYAFVGDKGKLTFNEVEKLYDECVNLHIHSNTST
jgi:hypothetical protein